MNENTFFGISADTLQGTLTNDATVQGVLTSPAMLQANLDQGPVVINDYVFTIYETADSYIFAARRGSQEQSLTLPKSGGGDGNVSSEQITDIVVLDKADYDALEVKSPTTQYLIRG